ncbi:MAG TPA: transglutaminase-like domain-containing protein [Alphaproteobacteria bacterium]|nr:transglutaminase-like domain-containing protein [Alphaproteobacteria bacterium]
MVDANLQNINFILDQAGILKDEEINLANTALALAALDSPGISIERYQHHLQTMVDEVLLRHNLLIEEGAKDDAATQLAAIKHIIADKYGYEGDSETYEDLQNVNLIRVIERRKGMPVSIALLYLHVGLAQGWSLAALNFPAHVVCRIEKDGQRILFDPFNQCKVLQAADMRQLLKTLVSPKAELSADYYIPSSRREVLIRMQNNIKLRLIEGEDYEAAVKTVEVMRRLDPQEYRLLLDAGVLYARTNQALAAIDVLEEYIDRAPNPEDQYDALILLKQIRESLN